MKVHRPLTSPGAGMVGLAVALGFLAFGVGAASRLATRTPHEKPPILLPLRSFEVRRVVIASADRQVELIRTGDGSWSSASGAPPGSEALMVNAEERLLPLGAYRSLTADALAPQYGLSAPEITFTVEDAGGHVRTVLLGAPTFTSGGFYARRATEAQRLYLVPRAVTYDLRSLLAGRRVDPPNELPMKARDLTKQAESAETEKVSGWLQQTLDAGVPLPEGLR